MSSLSMPIGPFSRGGLFDKLPQLPEQRGYSLMVSWPSQICPVPLVLHLTYPIAYIKKVVLVQRVSA